MLHQVSLIDTGNDYNFGAHRFEARCSCGSTGSYRSKELTDDWAKQHILFHTAINPVFDEGAGVWKVPDIPVQGQPVESAATVNTAAKASPKGTLPALPIKK